MRLKSLCCNETGQTVQVCTQMASRLATLPVPSFSRPCVEAQGLSSAGCGPAQPEGAAHAGTSGNPGSLHQVLARCNCVCKAGRTQTMSRMLTCGC